MGTKLIKLTKAQLRDREGFKQLRREILKLIDEAEMEQRLSTSDYEYNKFQQQIDYYWSEWARLANDAPDKSGKSKQRAQYKRWTIQEEKILINMYKKQINNSVIAKSFNLKTRQVKNKIQQLRNIGRL